MRFLLSTTAWGAIEDGFGLAKGSEVQQYSIQKGEGFELKNVSYKDKRGNNQSIDLILITSEKGVENAYQQAGLPAKEKDEIIQAFKDQGSQKSRLKNRKKPLNTAPIDSENRRLIVVDKELASATSNTEIETILLSRGVPKKDLESLSKNANARKRRSCWKDKEKSWDKSLNEKIDKNWHWGTNNSLSVDINATIKGKAKAIIKYKAKKFLCRVTVWVEVKQFIARADYELTGGIGVHGEASHTVDGHTWKIAEPRLAKGVFFIGYVPIAYNITLPINAGTGDLKLAASGNLEVDSTLSVAGHYAYGCDGNRCSKISSSITSDSIVNADTIQHEIMASAKIEPWVKVAVKGDIVWRFIEAEVGVKPSLPIALSAYYGNTCDDGDGVDGNETVNAGFADIDFRVGIEAGVGVLFGTWNWNKYWELHRADLYFKDFIQPFSTALSPVIRPHANGLKVEMPVSIRSCINSLADTNYQDFTINWGNGKTTPIYDLSNTVTYNHNYKSLGDYGISVAHANGASTTKWVTLNAISKPTISHILINESACRGAHAMSVDIEIYAGGNPTQFEVYNGNNIIYSGSNGAFQKMIFIEGGTTSINLKARASNSAGWGPFKHLTVRCEGSPLGGPEDKPLKDQV